MLKKSIISLSTDKAANLVCAAAHDLDHRLNQGSLFILQGLVESSNFIANIISTSVSHTVFISRQLGRRLQRRLNKELIEQFQEFNLDQITTAQLRMSVEQFKCAQPFMLLPRHKEES